MVLKLFNEEKLNIFNKNVFKREFGCVHVLIDQKKFI